MIRLLATTWGIFALVLCLGCTSDPIGPSRADALLITSPAVITGLSGGQGSLRLYRIVVPSGAVKLEVETSGGSGDVDLYIRRGDVPTLTRTDCASETNTTEEGCLAAPVGAGDWYILLRGLRAYSAVTLTATVFMPAT